MSELSTTQVAERLNVTRQQVGVWCRRGLFPNAREEDSGRGPVWRIPETDLRDFVRPKPTGRPPKLKPENDGNPSRKRATKKGGKK